MAYDYDTREMWLDDLDADLAAGTVYHLCTSHTRRMAPPVGWTMFDLRRPVLQLFSTRDVA